MRHFRRLCVYAGSLSGNDPRFVEAAAALGTALAERDIEVVYGGGGTGLMGALADAALQAKGRVTGVIPEKLYTKESAHHGLSELIVVDSMHTRKAIMSHLSDGFVVLPGGWGTLEELFEMSAWAQLGLHKKPIGLLNALGFYDPLLEFLNRGESTGFLRVAYDHLLVTAQTGDALLDAMSRASPRP